MNRFCLALNLVDDHVLINQVEQYHKNGWPEVKAGIRETGILNMEIYRLSNRLFMVMDVDK